MSSSDVNQILDTMDVQSQLIPEITAVVNQARDHIDEEEVSQNQQAQTLRDVAHEVLRNSPETEALRATFERSLRLMEEKIKRGMIFDGVTG